MYMKTKALGSHFVVLATVSCPLLLGSVLGIPLGIGGRKRDTGTDFFSE